MSTWLLVVMFELIFEEYDLASQDKKVGILESETQSLLLRE